MDDPGWAWPAWKFGMKRDDLFGKLHDQYNTFASTIQDPEAFHHDVYEISHEAGSEDEFHRLMSSRKQQRLRELNESLESAAIEIIANPKLIGTEQWRYALQLFRTKSLDSLVRYFSSYLPDDFFDRQGHYTSSSAASSFTDRCSIVTASTNPSSIDEAGGPSFFPDHDDKPMMTHEPFSITATSITTTTIITDLPPSPRSMTMQSETSATSPSDVEHHDFAFHTLTPARTLSFSGSESDAFCHGRPQCLHDDDDDEEETSQSDDPDSLATSISDLAESHSSVESMPDRRSPSAENGIEDGQDDEFPAAQHPTDVFDAESETPTPKPEPKSTDYLDAASLYHAQRIPSPYRASSPKLTHTRRRDGSPAQGIRRSPEESLSRIQKPVDPIRIRPKGRRRGLD